MHMLYNNMGVFILYKYKGNTDPRCMKHFGRWECCPWHLSFTRAMAISFSIITPKNIGLCTGIPPAFGIWVRANSSLYPVRSRTDEVFSLLSLVHVSLFSHGEALWMLLWPPISCLPPLTLSCSPSMPYWLISHFTMFYTSAIEHYFNVNF